MISSHKSDVRPPCRLPLCGRPTSSCLPKLFSTNSPDRVRIDGLSGSAKVLPKRLVVRPLHLGVVLISTNFVLKEAPARVGSSGS